MDVVMTLVWHPWTESQGGVVAGTQEAIRTLDLELRDAGWPRLPGVGETIFFDDGGAATVEAVGWKLDGTAYLYLGKKLEKKGETLQSWLGRGFHERASQPSAEESAGADVPTIPTELPQAPGQPAW
jgi:hypothetical protein